MINISAEYIKELRNITGASLVDCKKTLIEAQGDIKEAANILRRKGLVLADSKSNRKAGEGVIISYVHSNNKVGVLLEVNCETDFVARTYEFKEFAKDIAMQICAMAPRYVSREDIPKEVVDKEKKQYVELARKQKKPENILEKIADGKMNKFFSEICLLEQPFIKDQNIVIKELIKQKINKFGENVIVKRFVRYNLGESG